jgi:hypothetical protein
MTLRSVVLVLLLALAGSCSSSNPAPAAAGEIDAAGGTVAVSSGSLAGASVTIAANTFAEPVAVQIWADSTTAQDATADVGPAARFEPAGTALSPVGTFTMPFDPSRVPPGTTTSDYEVAARAADGSITEITPTQVDTANSLVTFSAAGFAVFWVTAPDRWATADYFPLNDGNDYLYEIFAENGSFQQARVTVTSTDSDPGLSGGPVWRLDFSLPWFHRAGLYLADDGSGGLLHVGLLDAPPQMPATLELDDLPVPWLMPIETIDSMRSSPYTYTGYRINLPDPPQQTHTGSGTLEVRIGERASVDTPVGRFGDCVTVEFVDTFMDTLGGSGTTTSRMWLARGVGPVQLQFGDADPVPIRAATVDGDAVSGG